MALRLAVVGSGLLMAAVAATSALRAKEPRFELYRSKDGGRSWSPASQGPPAHLRIHAIVAGGEASLAATDQDLYQSTDDGETWRRLEGRPAPSGRILSLASTGRRLYSGTTAGVFVSDDGRRSWSRVGRALSTTRISALATDGDRVFAGTDGAGVFVLEKAAADWTSTGPGLPERAQVHTLLRRPDGIIAGLYAKGVYRLGRDGEWSSLGPAPAFRLAAVGGRLYAGLNGGGGGVMVSDVPGVWLKSSEGLPEHAAIWAMTEAGRSVLVGTSGKAGVFRSDTAGLLWLRSDAGLPEGSSAVTLASGDGIVLAQVMLP